jgi:predicted secreted protein
MTGLQAIIVYFVCWWLLLFMALPVGVRRMEHPEAGQEPGAPEKTYLAVKFMGVTILAGLATWAIDLIVNSGIVAVK